MSRYRKAYWSAVAAACTTVGMVADGVSTNDLVGLITLWGGVVGVLLWPNDPPPGEPADPDMSERDA